MISTPNIHTKQYIVEILCDRSRLTNIFRSVNSYHSGYNHNYEGNMPWGFCLLYGNAKAHLLNDCVGGCDEAINLP